MRGHTPPRGEALTVTVRVSVIDFFSEIMGETLRIPCVSLKAKYLQITPLDQPLIKPSIFRRVSCHFAKNRQENSYGNYKKPIFYN
jgi:hypothetical protein